MEKKSKKGMYTFYTNKPLKNKTKTLILQINYFLLKKEKNTLQVDKNSIV